MKRILLLSFILCNALSYSQKTIKIKFTSSFNNESIELHKNYFSSTLNDSISFSKLKYYIGKLNFYNNSKLVYSVNKYFLVDIDIDSFITVQVPLKLRFSKINFLLGIDSATNNKPNFKEVLDPRKGMYWAWHSGYINLKLEGKSNSCPTINNNFQFHLGGFLNNQLAARTLVFNTKNSTTIHINFNVEQFLNAINLKTTNTIMTPSKQAVDLSEIASKCFYIIN
jgi:hypothetical protein